MRFTRLLLLAIACSTLALGGCRKQKEVPSGYAYTSFETTFMGSDMDGSQRLRAWGRGVNQGDAIETAKKQAVYDVIFKGIPGAKGAAARPIVTEVNARDRYANYFDPFFSDGGEYGKFVREENSGPNSRIHSKGSGQENWGVVVTVDRPGLRAQLIKDNVIRE